MSRLTDMAKVCTYLSNVLGRFLVSWLVVAIDRARTIQVFVFEMEIWLITRFPQTTPMDDTQKLSVSWSSTHVPMDVPEE